MDDRAELVAGRVLRCRYDSQSLDSPQGTKWRVIRIVAGPHMHIKFKQGEIITVQDLTDPDQPGREKAFYVHRFLRRCTIEASPRFNRSQPGARRVSWDDEGDAPAAPSASSSASSARGVGVQQRPTKRRRRTRIDETSCNFYDSGDSSGEETE